MGAPAVGDPATSVHTYGCNYVRFGVKSVFIYCRVRVLDVTPQNSFLLCMFVHHGGAFTTAPVNMAGLSEEEGRPSRVEFADAHVRVRRRDEPHKPRNEGGRQLPHCGGNVPPAHPAPARANRRPLRNKVAVHFLFWGFIFVYVLTLKSAQPPFFCFPVSFFAHVLSPKPRRFLRNKKWLYIFCFGVSFLLTF